MAKNIHDKTKKIGLQQQRVVCSNGMLNTIISKIPFALKTTDPSYADACDKLNKAFGVNVGDRVESIEPLEESHCFEIDEVGLLGTVVCYDEYGGLLVVLDKHFEDLDEWDNCIIRENQDHLPDCFKAEFRKIPE